MAKKSKAQEVTTEVEPIVAEWVCGGMRSLQDGGTANAWFPLTEKLGVDPDKYRLYGVDGIVGGIYRMTYFEEGDTISLFTKGPKAPLFVRMYADKKRQEEWRAESDKARTLKRTRQEERKMKKDADRIDGLEPFALAFANSDRYGRAAIIANISVYLERRASEIQADWRNGRRVRSRSED